MLPVVERDLVDGVPVLRSTGVAGRHGAALVFRVGQFDEALPNRGITHMVEHLTFGGHHEARYQFNASVDGCYTRYLVESQDPADIAAYLRAVCEGLAADHGQVLDRERRILRTEAASRGGAGMLGNCLVERYGAPRSRACSTTPSSASTGWAGRTWRPGARAGSPPGTRCCGWPAICPTDFGYRSRTVPPGRPRTRCRCPPPGRPT